MQPQPAIAPPPVVAGQPLVPAQQQVNPQRVAAPTPIAPPTATQLTTAGTAPGIPPAPASPQNAAPGIMGQIASLYQIPGQTAQIVNAGQAQGNVAQQQFELQKGENQVKIQNLQNQLNPSEYTVQKDPSTGGIKIINSLGDQVDLGTYVNLTGQNPAEVLQNAGVTDEADQKFIAAYTNLQNYIQTKIAAQNGSTQALAELGDYYKQNPGLQNLELGQLSQAFMQQYGTYFGQPQGNQNTLQGLGVNPTVQSAANPITTSPYENLAFYSAENTANPYASNLAGAAGGSLEQQLQALQNTNGGQ